MRRVAVLVSLPTGPSGFLPHLALIYRNLSCTVFAARVCAPGVSVVVDDQDTLCGCRTAGWVVAGIRLVIRYRRLGSKRRRTQARKSMRAGKGALLAGGSPRGPRSGSERVSE